MIKKILCLACAMALLCAPLAMAEGQERSFSQDMKDFGAFLGEKMSDFGEQMKHFAEDPERYIQVSGIKERIRQQAEQAGQSIQEYWPTFKASVLGSVDVIMNSDMSWAEKKEQLKEYGELAVPILADVDFEAMGEDAKQSLEAIKGLMGFETDEQTKLWIEENKQKLKEIRDYLAS